MQLTIRTDDQGFWRVYDETGRKYGQPRHDVFAALVDRDAVLARFEQVNH